MKRLIARIGFISWFVFSVGVPATAGEVGNESWSVVARMGSDELLVGEVGSFRVTVEGLELSEAGAILQLEVPNEIELVESIPRQKQLTPEMVVLGALRFPYGRPVTTKSTRVPFRVLKPLGVSDRIGLNIVAYGREKPADQEESPVSSERLFRRRLVLPLVKDALGQSSETASFRWSAPTLQLGDRARFSLPRADGSRLSSEEDFGDWMVVVTYRGAG